MTRDQVLLLIQDSFDSLLSADLLTEPVVAADATTLLGPDSLLDSIAFVTFMVELEDRIHQTEGAAMSDFSLAINEIHERSSDESGLTVGSLADYVVNATATPR
jgi:acyl carrier protein